MSLESKLVLQHLANHAAEEDVYLHYRQARILIV